MKMRKLWDRVFILAWIYCNKLSTADGPINYRYFSEEETVTLNCLSDANAVVWTGPAQNSSNPTPVPANDPFGTEKSWMTAVYTNAREINQHLPNYKRLRFVGSKESGDFSLEIRNMALSDEGYYRCAIYSGNEIPLHFKVYILLLKTLPTNITINNETEEETIIGAENQEMRLVCNVKSGLPPETILWKINGSILKKGGPGRIVYQFNPNRTFHKLNVTCEIMNNVTERPLTKSIRLDIKFKPEILISREPSGALFEGSKKKLCCEIDSNPNVIFMAWYNSITQIKNNSSTCLVLEKVTRQDSGNYTCFAGNEIGNGSFTASIVVFYPPTVSVEYNTSTIHKNKRYVYCKAEGVPTNFTFYRLEHRSHFNEHIRYLEVTSNGIAELPYTTGSHIYQDTGLYICNASNGVSDRRGQLFQQGDAYLIYNAPPVFVDDNKKTQYGELGKPMDITVRVYSASEIECLNLNAIVSLNIKDILKKSVHLIMSFHGVNITVNGKEVTFRLAKLLSFQWFNITVCNDFAMSSFILEVRQSAKYSSKDKSITSEGIVIAVLLIIIVVFIGIHVRYLIQRHIKRRITVPTDQTTERNSAESAHYIEIVDDNNVRAIFHEQNNQMVLADSRLVVENRNPSFVSEELNLDLSNNDRDTSEHTISSSDNEIDALELLDDGYERPYTTLVSHTYAENEHGYSSTTKSSTKETSTTWQNAISRPCTVFTEPDKQKIFIFTDDGQQNTKQNKGEYINVLLKHTIDHPSLSEFSKIPKTIDEDSNR